MQTITTENQNAVGMKHYRQRMKESGLRYVQFWVIDTRNSEFIERINRQCLALKNDPAEKEILSFVDEATSQIEGWV